MTEKWWLSLKIGDRVYVPLERNSRSGMAEVYGNGRKYISLSLAGRPIRVRKSDGCIDEYPYNQICRDEKDHMDFIWQRKRFREASDSLVKLALSKPRVSKADADAIELLLQSLCGENT